MISVSNLTMSFSGKDLFSDVSFVINKTDRIGLTGKNGAGKTTLLNIIAGIQKSDKGSVNFPKEMSIGYLPQKLTISSDKTIYDETLTAFDEVVKLEEDIEELTHKIEEIVDYESDEYSNLIEELIHKQDRFDYLDGNKIESNIEKILKGLGFKDTDFNRNINEFSGGWQMRVELAKLLLKNPDLILLDEPTNHLDIESIIWMESFLKNYHSAVMMVSHDVMFLDNITNRTIEIVLGKIYDYKAPYSKYLNLREERLENQLATIRNQQKYIEEQERFINRFKAQATKARQVQSKMKQLDKIERIEVDKTNTQSIQFSFPPAPRSGAIVLEAKNVSKNYDKIEVLNNLNFAVKRGEKISFVGKNGEGKSTLVKIIANVEAHDGELVTGYNVAASYFAQKQDNTLNEKYTVYETIEREAVGDWANISKIRGLLGAFLFSGDDVDKKVKVLSGGEKSRLALAKLLLKPSNLLILDEPTNHLDISAKEVLKKALQKYDGTLIIVSHDRSFLQGLTSKTFEFKDKKIKEHIGDISEFLNTHKIESFREFELNNKKLKEEKTKNKELKLDADSNKSNQSSRKDIERKLRKLEKTIEEQEALVSKLEKEIEEQEVLMQQTNFHNDENHAINVCQKHDLLNKQLEETIKAWEQSVKELELQKNS